MLKARVDKVAQPKRHENVALVTTQYLFDSRQLVHLKRHFSETPLTIIPKLKQTYVLDY